MKESRNLIFRKMQISFSLQQTKGKVRKCDFLVTRKDDWNDDDGDDDQNENRKRMMMRNGRKRAISNIHKTYRYGQFANQLFFFEEYLSVLLPVIFIFLPSNLKKRETDNTKFSPIFSFPQMRKGKQCLLKTNQRLCRVGVLSFFPSL